MTTTRRERTRSLQTFLIRLQQRYPMATVRLLEAHPSQVVVQLDQYSITLAGQRLVEVTASLNCSQRIEQMAREIEQLLSQPEQERRGWSDNAIPSKSLSKRRLLMSHHGMSTPSAAITPARLEWLCQPEQIEHTLCLLWKLHAWQRASDRLLYADRQGLADVQACVLEQATRAGRLHPVTYVDGRQRFPGELLLQTAAEDAARALLIHLHSLGDPDVWPPSLPKGDRLYQRYIRPLFRRITGHTYQRAAQAATALEVGQIQRYIQDRLDQLIERARATGQPLCTLRMAALCLAPIDLLPIRENRAYFLDSYESWDELDESDQRKLDPEGYSQVAFAYQSASAAFVFPVSLRRAETFVSAERIRELQKWPGRRQEQGIIEGVPLHDEDSLAHPPKDMLQELDVEIARVCPHELGDKASYLARPTMRDLLWPTVEQDSQTWANDPWDGLCLPPGQR